MVQGATDIMFWASLIFLTAVLFSFLLFLLRYRTFVKIGLRNSARRLPQAVSLCIGGIIGTSTITGALVIGDSLDRMVVEQSVKALGDVDIVITSPRFFDNSVYLDIVGSPDIMAITDKTAPVIALRGSVRFPDNKATEGSVNIFGIENSFYDFGSFYRGGEKIPNIQQGQCVVNSYLAENLGVTTGNTITLNLNGPKPPDAFFLTSDSENYKINLTIIEIYENRGLASLNLNSRNTNINNLFLGLDQIQNVLGNPGKINTVMISNNGDELEGTRMDGKVVEALEEVLDEHFGLFETGYGVITDGDQLVITHEEVLFDPDPLLSGGNEMVISEMLTYFVNSISSSNESISYSTITGLDVVKDRPFGEFYSKGKGFDPEDLLESEIILTDWTARELGIGIGEKVTLNYTVLTNDFQHSDATVELSVKSIVNITGKASREWLMPDIPGIKEIDTCDDWAPPFEIDLTTIRESDLDYWEQYRGIPKGYIDLELAQYLFGNYQGNLTHVKIMTTNSKRPWN